MNRRMDHLRGWAVAGVLIGLGLAFALAGGGCSTLTGIARDVRGAVEGMAYSADTNGQRVPSGR